MKCIMPAPTMKSAKRHFEIFLMVVMRLLYASMTRHASRTWSVVSEAGAILTKPGPPPDALQYCLSTLLRHFLPDNRQTGW
jgi:hypothetical protein